MIILLVTAIQIPQSKVFAQLFERSALHSLISSSSLPYF